MRWARGGGGGARRPLRAPQMALLDENHDGVVSLEEFTTAMRKVRCTMRGSCRTVLVF